MMNAMTCDDTANNTRAPRSQVKKLIGAVNVNATKYSDTNDIATKIAWRTRNLAMSSIPIVLRIKQRIKSVSAEAPTTRNRVGHKRTTCEPNVPT